MYILKVISMHNQIPGFWQWYFLDSRKDLFQRVAKRWWTKLLLILASVVFVYVWFSDVFSPQNKLLWLILLKNPFAILVITFVLSCHLSLEYLEYKVLLKTSQTFDWQGFQQKKIRALYKELYGPDKFYKMYDLFLLGGFVSGLLLPLSMRLHWF
jgi:hypothetical protein